MHARVCDAEMAVFFHLFCAGPGREPRRVSCAAAGHRGFRDGGETLTRSRCWGCGWLACHCRKSEGGGSLGWWGMAQIINLKVERVRCSLQPVDTTLALAAMLAAAAALAALTRCAHLHSTRHDDECHHLYFRHHHQLPCCSARVAYFSCWMSLRASSAAEGCCHVVYPQLPKVAVCEGGARVALVRAPPPIAACPLQGRCFRWPIAHAVRTALRRHTPAL